MDEFLDQQLQPPPEIMPKTEQEIGQGFSGEYAVNENGVSRAKIEIQAGRESGGNEDRFVIGNNIYGVFDGASGLTPLTQEARESLGLTGGAVAASIVAEELSRPSSEKLIDRLMKANERIGEAFTEFGPDSTELADRFCCTAGIIQVNEAEIEMVCVADTPILVIRSDGSFELPIPNIDQDAESIELLNMLINEEGLTHEEAMNDPRMKEQLLTKRREQNSTYGVLNGDPSVSEHLRSASIPKDDVETILILSDGLIPPTRPGEEPNWGIIVEAYQSGGIQAVKDVIRSIEDGDPGCSEFPRFKMHDDASILEVSFKDPA